MDKMKAAICTKYGTPDVFKIVEVEKPAPKDNEVCVKIYATSVTASDIFIRSSDVPLRLKIPMRIMLGILKHRNPIIGQVFAGIVESVGKNTRRFKHGDSVYGLTGYRLGAYAEYKCIKEIDSTKGCIALMPGNISYEEATVAAYGGLLSLQHIERADIKKGDKALVYGASGNSGTLAVQILKHSGAEVTAVCRSSNFEMVQSLGADHVMDYTKHDSPPEGAEYDFIIDTAGLYKTSKFKDASKKALSPNGKYVSIDDGALKLDSQRLHRITNLVETGHFRLIIDRCYPLEEMADAHRYFESGQKKGGIAITVYGNK